MIGGHGRIGDAQVYTLSCQDRIVMDENANLDVNNIKAMSIFCSEICARSTAMPLFISSNVTFGEDVAFQKDLFIEGNLIAGSSGTLDITGNVIITNKLTVGSGLSVGADTLIKGNLIVNDKLCVGNLITAKNGLDVTSDLNVDGGMTVLQDALFEGNIVVSGTIISSGNVAFGNLVVDRLYVHEIFGHSPISLLSPAHFLSSSNFSQLVSLLSADLSCRFGSKIQVLDGGDLQVHGGNVKITPLNANIIGGGQLMVMDGGDVHVLGGNINVTGHHLTGRGSIAVVDGGDINLRNGGSLTINDGGNVVIMDSGNLVLHGGAVVMINPVTMVESTLTFPIPEIHGGTNQTTYTKGDMLYASGADTLAKLAIGSAGDVLSVSGTGVPQWAPGGLVGQLARVTSVFMASTTPVDALSNTLNVAQPWIMFGAASPGGYWVVSAAGYYIWRVTATGASNVLSTIVGLSLGQTFPSQMSPLCINCLINGTGTDNFGTAWGSFYCDGLTTVQIGGRCWQSVIAGNPVTVSYEITKVF